MARAAREKSVTGMYNVILKGNKDVFLVDDDYINFIERLDELNVLGFGLIHDRVFLCVKESEKGIAADMRSIIISYARYYNKKYELEGKLFQGRFKSEPINSGSELQNSISIVQNVTDLTGEDGFVSQSKMIDFEMIPFFASSMGAPKSKKHRKPSVKKPKAASAPEPTSKPKAAESKIIENKPEPPAPKPKQNKNLPSWLL